MVRSMYLGLNGRNSEMVFKRKVRNFDQSKGPVNDLEELCSAKREIMLIEFQRCRAPSGVVQSIVKYVGFKVESSSSLVEDGVEFDFRSLFHVDSTRQPSISVSRTCSFKNEICALMMLTPFLHTHTKNASSISKDH